MKIAVLSDIHSNHLALKAVMNHIEKLESTRQWKISEYWFTGDLLGYGPQALEVLRIAREKFETRSWILGNHDALYAGYLLSDLVREEAVDAILKNTEQINQDAEMAEWINNVFVDLHHRQSLILDSNGDGVTFTLAHGCMKDAYHLYVYPWTKPEILDDYMIIPAKKLFNGEPYPRVILFGHSHVPALIRYTDNNFEDVRIEEYGKPYAFSPEWSMINPGSVGQPRDFDDRAAYAVLDTAEKTVTFFRVAYEVEDTALDLQKGHYPNRLLAQLMKADGLKPSEAYTQLLKERANRNGE